jgi:Fe-S cluster assembly protein SufD
MSLLDSLLVPAAVGVAPIAERGRAALRQFGLPGARDEAWRYTPLRALSARSFALQDADAATRALPADARAHIESAPLRLVFVNGALREDLSTLAALPAGLAIDAAVPASDESPAAARDAFVAANLALAQAGAQVGVAAGVAIDEPLHVFHVGLAGTAAALHVRLRVRIGEGARFRLIETHLGDADAAHLGNRLLECELETGARLTHTRSADGAVQASGIHASRYRIDRGAEARTFELVPGQALYRHQVDADLVGDGARFVSGGVQAVSGRAHADVQLGVHHRARDTACDLLWRGIADGRARLGFTGNLEVAAGADGADAKLGSKNLLLSPHAEINTRPVLVIHADEVKAAHGATVGRLDERALFYLCARGIPRSRARVMLTHAFAIEALQALDDEDERARLAPALRAAMTAFTGADDGER